MKTHLCILLCAGCSVITCLLYLYFSFTGHSVTTKILRNASLYVGQTCSVVERSFKSEPALCQDQGYRVYKCRLP